MKVLNLLNFQQYQNFRFLYLKNRKFWYRWNQEIQCFHKRSFSENRIKKVFLGPRGLGPRWAMSGSLCGNT